MINEKKDFFVMLQFDRSIWVKRNKDYYLTWIIWSSPIMTVEGGKGRRGLTVEGGFLNKPDNDRGGRMTVGKEDYRGMTVENRAQGNDSRADVLGELNNYKKTQVVPAFF